MDEIVGWIGAGLIILDYFLLATKRVSSTSKIYHLMNLLGAIGIGINAYVKGATPSIGTNTVWVLIAFMVYIKALKRILEGTFKSMI